MPNHASTLTVSRMLKHAELVYAKTPDAKFELLRSGSADVFASKRFALLKYSAKQPGFRALEDRYGANLLALGTEGHARRLAYVSEFIEETKASGLVQKTIDRAGPHGVTVAQLEILQRSGQSPSVLGVGLLPGEEERAPCLSSFCSISY